MNIKSNFLGILRDKLEIAFNEEWHEQRPTRFEITETEGSVLLTFFLKTKNGSWLSVHEKKVSELRSEKDVDDILAESLSMFLMGHYRWPR